MIELSSNQTSLTLDPQGAYVVNLTTNGQEIFYPKTNLKTPQGEIKTRGGMHVCLPNFGPDSKHGLNQHGFGRELTWQIINQTQNQVELELDGGQPPYQNLKSVLQINLSDNQANFQLILTNLGQKTLEVAPAFHPYFQLQNDETAVVIDGETLKLAQLSGTLFRSKLQRAQTKNFELRFWQNNLPQFAIWTDLLDDYVCLEPSFAGNAFVDGTADNLAPNQTKDYGFELAWR